MPMEAEIAVRQLEAGGFSCTWKRVDSEAALRARARGSPSPTSSFPISRCPDSTASPRSRFRASSRPTRRSSSSRARSAKSAPSTPCSAARTTTCSRPTWRGSCPPCAARSTMPPSAARASRSSSSCATSSPPRRTGSGNTTATASSRSAATRCAPRSATRPRKCSARNASQYVHPGRSRGARFRHAHAGPEPAHRHQPAGALAPSQRQLSLARAQHAGVAGRGRAGRRVIRGSERDFTERRRQEKHISRLTRVLKMLSGVNSAMVRIRQRREILVEACRLATSVGGYASAMVALIEPGTRTARPTAWSGSVDNQAAQQLTFSIAEIAGRRFERHRPRVAHRRFAGLQRSADSWRWGWRRAPRSWIPASAASSPIRCWSTARRSAR